MHSQDNKQKLHEKLKEFMSTDRAKHHILPLSKFGLMQITRQRVRPEMNIKTIEKCPSCNGSGEVNPTVLLIDELENHVRWTLSKYKNRKITLVVHPFVASFLNKGFFSIRFKWRVKYLKRLKIKSSNSLTFLEYHFYDKHGDRILN